MHATDLLNIAGTTAAILSLLTIAVWACRDWRQMKNRRQADEAIATLETAIRARPKATDDWRKGSDE